jgi:hypothetical protein
LTVDTRLLAKLEYDRISLEVLVAILFDKGVIDGTDVSRGTAQVRRVIELADTPGGPPVSFSVPDGETETLREAVREEDVVARALQAWIVADMTPAPPPPPPPDDPQPGQAP